MPDIPTRMWPTVERFAQSLGLAAVPRRDGSVAFAFERTGTLTFAPTPEGDQVVMTLVRPSDLSPASILAAGGYNPALSAIVHAGLTPSGDPALSLVYEADTFDVPRVAAHVSALGETLGAH
ncbi:MAG: hypothetical protein AAF318_01385 [Pseudomonadota bacterium]